MTSRVRRSGFRVRPLGPDAACHGPVGRAGRSRARRAMLLVAVLTIITVLALLGASFSYLMNAQLTSVNAQQDQQQAYFAARAGIDRAIEMLRAGRVLQDNWYNNFQAFRRIPVYIPGDRDDDVKGGSTSLADQERVPGLDLWRFSVVAAEIPRDDTQKAKIRYGLTDEAAKVNLNTATRSQLIAIFDLIRHDNVTSAALADALIDWRDADDEASPEGVESSYYLKLKPAYRCKNGPLASIEELLMIKGFTGRVIYGEDYNRNGYLDDNENDGEEGAFPPDDGDGKLDRGLLPFVTVYSWDWNRANDNKTRTDVNTASFSQVASGANLGGTSGGGQDNANGGNPGLQDLAALLTRVPAQVTDEIRPEVIDFIAAAQKRGYRFKSIGDMLGLEIYANGRTNHDRMWRQYAREFRQAEARIDDEAAQAQAGDMAAADLTDDEDDEPGDGRTGGSGSRTGGGSGAQNQGNQNRNGRDSGRPGRDSDKNDRTGDWRDDGNPGAKSDSKGSAPRLRLISDEQTDANSAPPPVPPRTGPRPRRPNRNDDDGDDRPPVPPNAAPDDDNADARGPGSGPPADGPGGGGPGGRGGRGGGGGQGRLGGGQGGRNPNAITGTPGGNAGSTGGNVGNQGGNQGGGTGTTLSSPVEVSDLPALCDRLTVWNAPVMAGLINVNTAPVQVLRTIPGLTADDAEAIVEKRGGLQGADKLTTAWLVTSGAISPETFALISNLVTTRSIQFTIDAIGFNDRVGTVKRVQAVVEMRGELATIKYFRDITSLGVGFPVWDDQRSEGFAFTDR